MRKILNELLKIIKSRRFLLHLLLMLLLLIATIWGVRAYLDSYTLHGQTISVPDLRGGSFEEAEEALAERELNAILRDSIHVEDAEPGSVVEQDPSGEKQVKKGRNIYITIQATKAEKVSMPDLVDKSRRQAVSILRSVGLSVGEFRFEPDICADCVIEQRHKGKRIEAGARLPKGSSIELILGAGQGNEKTSIPNLIGHTIEEAEKRLLQATLNVGAIQYEEGCCPSKKDSANAKVYHQSPSPFQDERIRTGSSVTLWLTTNDERVDSASATNDTLPPEELQEPEP